ncbi:uncharacterized protein LOC132196210 [Neocloeon triangulifer]|uniref:uncharacterized protein LOC132196210 n=1 Tax=Neocloeon triangulifer TaxID=2078957 RepID=UPI00286F3333|nr:uncharacterized protein LOC132196210 [Neocloeon triangulifer]
MENPKAYWVRVKFKGYEEDYSSDDLKELSGKKIGFSLKGMAVRVDNYQGHIIAFAESQEQLVRDFGSLGPKKLLYFPPKNPKRQPKKNLLLEEFLSPASEKNAKRTSQQKRKNKSIQLQNKKQVKKHVVNQIDHDNLHLQTFVTNSANERPTECSKQRESASSMMTEFEKYKSFYEKFHAAGQLGEKTPAKDSSQGMPVKTAKPTNTDIVYETESEGVVSDSESESGAPTISPVKQSAPEQNMMLENCDDEQEQEESHHDEEKSTHDQQGEEEEEEIRPIRSRDEDEILKAYRDNSEFQLKWTLLPEDQKKDFYVYKEGSKEVWLQKNGVRKAKKSSGTPFELLSSLVKLGYKRDALRKCTLDGSARGGKGRRPCLHKPALNAIFKIVRSVATDVQESKKKIYRKEEDQSATAKSPRGRKKKSWSKMMDLVVVLKYADVWKDEFIEEKNLRKMVVKILSNIRNTPKRKTSSNPLKKIVFLL